MAKPAEVFDPLRTNALRVARDAEVTLRRKEARDAVRRRPDLDLLVPARFISDESGRRELFPEPTLALVGDYLRRARRLAGMSQATLAKASGVSQPMISRIERARAPGVPLERMVALCLPLGRLFPLGVCPHDHACPWQPYRPITHEITDASKYIEYLLKISDEPSVASAPSDAFDYDSLAFVQRE